MFKNLDCYEDAYGNKIYGWKKVENKEFKISFSGSHSIIEIGENVCCQNSELHVGSNSRIVIENGIFLTESKICIEDKVDFEIKRGCKIKNLMLRIDEASEVLLDEEIEINGKAEWHIYNSSKLEIGCRTKFYSGALSHGGSTLFKIGQDVSIASGYRISVGKYTRIMIGDDCMFSFDVELRSNDGHSIFDLKTGKNINSTYEISKSREIIIGNHVWCGVRSIILYNANIGDGSIVGASALVKGVIPSNCIAAGVPAKVVKTDVAWSREYGAENFIK